MKNVFIVFCILLILLSSCKKEDSEIKLTKPEIDGVVQKGPFLNGTSISIFELNDDCTPTGKTFSSQILDNSGTFQLNNVSLISPYVLLKADGYYFNEMTGKNSNSPITLYALTDITSKTTVNVNILSNLEKAGLNICSRPVYRFQLPRNKPNKKFSKYFRYPKLIFLILIY